VLSSAVEKVWGCSNFSDLLFVYSFLGQWLILFCFIYIVSWSPIEEGIVACNLRFMLLSLGLLCVVHYKLL
jgi:hypothetical protein